MSKVSFASTLGLFWHFGIPQAAISEAQAVPILYHQAFLELRRQEEVVRRRVKQERAAAELACRLSAALELEHAIGNLSRAAVQESWDSR